MLKQYKASLVLKELIHITLVKCVSLPYVNLMEEQLEVYTWMIVFVPSLAYPHHSSIAASQP